MTCFASLMKNLLLSFSTKILSSPQLLIVAKKNQVFSKLCIQYSNRNVLCDADIVAFVVLWNRSLLRKCLTLRSPSCFYSNNEVMKERNEMNCFTGPPTETMVATFTGASYNKSYVRTHQKAAFLKTRITESSIFFKTDKENIRMSPFSFHQVW